MAQQPKSQKGQGLIEYALIIVLIVIVAIVIFTVSGVGKKSNSGGFLAPSTAYAEEPEPKFTSSMIFDWCRDPQDGSGVDRWCYGDEYIVTKNTVEVRAHEGQLLNFHMKFWHLGITEPNTYRLTYKVTWSDGSTQQDSIDPAFFVDGYLLAVVKLELKLERI